MAVIFDIHDDLHGTVLLEAHERKIVDSPLFQRLRRIRQLGLANLVFPGAEHTRFGHSIGVFHLASRLAQRLESATAITPEEARELRAAALLHDIGHFPFSHTLEKVYEGLAQAQPEDWVEPVDGGEGPVGAFQGPHGIAETQFHEDFGRRVIEETDYEGGVTQALHESELDPQRVAAIVVGAHENVLLNQIVHSDLDVDQLDYLLRDAKATGSAYGQYDLSYLIGCMEVVRVDGKPVLCVAMQGLHPLEHYVLAKYFYYMCILYQKTRCIAEGLLQAIAVRLIGKGRIPSWPDIEAALAEGRLPYFDDIAVWQAIRDAGDDESLEGELRDAISCLVDRRLPKVESERHVTIAQEEDLPGGVQFGATGHVWNELARDAVNRQCRQRFTVLRKVPYDAGDPHSLAMELEENPTPIRIVVKEPYDVPAGVLALDAETLDGEACRVALLESLTDSIVAKLAGQTTHIARVYRPA